MEQLKILGPDLWYHVTKFLSLKEIFNLMSSCKFFLYLLEDSSIWSRFVRKKDRTVYDLFAKNNFNDWKSLVKKLMTLRKSVVKECYLCHLNNIYWRDIESDKSEYGRIASLCRVCWFEVKCQFSDVPKGYYDVLLRMNIPIESAANFDCKWRVTDQNNKEFIKFTHGKKDKIFMDQVGKGWKIFSVGKIYIKEDCQIKIHLLGGNKYWFHELQLDWFQLRPIPQSVYENGKEPCFYEE